MKQLVIGLLVSLVTAVAVTGGYLYLVQPYQDCQLLGQASPVEYPVTVCLVMLDYAWVNSKDLLHP